MNIDIKFIAKMADVSPATVSRVVNCSKPVSEELRLRVLEAIEKYGYRPNSMARGLILKKSCLIGVMVPNVSNYFHARLVSAIEQYADSLGYSVILVNLHNDFAHQKKHFLTLYDHQVDGILLLHENSIEELCSLLSLADIPIVLASAHVPASALVNVAIDDEKAAYDAVSYLIGLGHRRIGGIFNDCYSLGTLRRRGYERALKEAGVRPDEGITAMGGLSIEEGMRCTGELFSNPLPPTAVFCVSDELAVGAVNWLTDHNYRVPGDVSVVGFDDISLASCVRPRLTTIRQPIEEIGTKAAGILLSMIEGNAAAGSANRRILLPHTLVIRESSGPAPDRM